MPKRPSAEEYRRVARMLHHSDGDLEFDADAVVSVSEDEGAYVACWKYVYDSQTDGYEEEDDDAPTTD